MKQDIRDLFKEEEELKTPPKNHRNEFLNKLNKNNKRRPNLYKIIGVAAILMLTLTIVFNVVEKDSAPEQISPMVAQVEAVEAQYLKEINTEWENFIAITDDEVLIKRFEERLSALDKDYQLISEQFKNDSNNIMVVENLVENLQIRLQILKDIQEHIKILNQKNEQYENTI